MARVLGQRVTGRTVALIAGETALMIGAAAASAYAVAGPTRWEHATGMWARILLIAGVAQVCTYGADLYDHGISRNARERFARTIEALAAAALVLAMIYVSRPTLIAGSGVAVLTMGLLVAAMTMWRLAFERVVQAVGREERLVIIGTDTTAVHLWHELDARRHLGVTVVGFVAAGPVARQQPEGAPPLLGTTDALVEIVGRFAVDRVVISLADARGLLAMSDLLHLRMAGVAVDHLPSVYEECTGKVCVDQLRPSWLVFSRGFRATTWRLRMKRACDLVAGAVGLLVTAPVLAAAAAAIKLTSPGPVLYSQERVGRAGRRFVLYKFRSMRTDAEASTGAIWAAADDARITPVGRWLRRARIDELPQLWNVLRGDMSLIGPRPERPEFVDWLSREIPYYAERHAVKPGLTGWAQVRYPYGASVEDAREKLQYELFYIKNFSLSLDLLIALKTVKIVLLGRGR